MTRHGSDLVLGGGAGCGAEREGMESYLRGCIARAAGVAAAAVDPRLPLGGAALDSLAVVELQHEIETELGVELPLAGLFEAADLAGLAALVAARLEAAAGPAAWPWLAADPPGEPFPLSWGQRALWFEQRLAAGATDSTGSGGSGGSGIAAYHIAVAARAVAGLDVPALARAWRQLARRLPVLRTRFTESAGEPAQWVDDALEPELALHDADGWPAAALHERLQADVARPFDLASGPPLRLAIWQLAAGEHVLLVTVHHLVADFHSLAILAADLGRLYAAERGAAAPPAAPLRPAYRRFVEWQQDLLAGPRGEELWQACRRRLAGAPLAIDLAGDRPRPAAPSHASGAESIRLDASLADRLRGLAGAAGATPFVVLLAAFQTLLHRWSGQETLLVGSPAAGRTAARLDDVVGYLVNPLVLRADFPAEVSFAGLLEGARRDVLDALEHQDYPFALLAERLQPVRSAGRGAVFQVMLVWQRARRQEQSGLAAFALGAAGERLDLGGLELRSMELEQRHAPLDLTLALAEVGGELCACLTYSRDLYDGVSARRMLGHLRILLAAAAADPALPAAALPLLTPDEERQLLGEAAAPDLPSGRELCLHRLCAAQAKRTPAAVALICRGEHLTYAELDRRAGRLAARLRAQGVGAETTVGVLLERSARLVTALLAVLKAGGAYLPLDPAYPAERLAFMLEDSAAALLLTAPAPAAALLARGPAPSRLLWVDEAPEPPAGGPPPLAGWPPAPAAEPRNLAYVIYTSGSSGRPKGVAIEHASAAALMHWAREVFPPADLAGVLAATSVCFDLSVFELFAPLCWGGTVILAENALELPALAAAGRVTLANTVPSAMEELLRGSGLPPSVRTVNLAGEPLAGRLVRRIHGAAVERVLNLYGPSEDTTYSTFAEVPAAGGGEPTIGRPLPGTRVRLLDRRGRLVPIGVPGELHLGGAGLARGYLRRPDLTAERFVPDAYAAAAGGRLYRTGDLARRRDDGQLEFLGRTDHQVKVRGFRIELGEVEAALLSCPGVREAVVTVQEARGGGGAREDGGKPGEPGGLGNPGNSGSVGGTGDRRLVAYVAVGAGGAGVAEAAPAPAAEELRALLGRRLPHHMLPAAWVFLAALPRTPNGKADRRALPPPPADDGAAAAASGPVEEVLAEIWCDLLGMERIGAGANFFALGGHSLLSTRMLSRVRDAFQVELPLAAVFEAQTLGGMAARIAAAQVDGTPAAAAIVRVEHDGAPPLSFAQERLWFLDQLEPMLAVYNVPGALRWKERLDVAALAGAFDEIVRRHEVLRARIETVADRPVQIIMPARRLRLPLADLSALRPHRGEAEARRLAAGFARRPFDLARGPLLRVALVRLAAADHLVLATLHHIASDGWSLGVLLREMAVLYDAFAHGRSSPLPALPLRYSDYARWQRSWLQGDRLAAQLDLWRRRLAGAPPALELPTDRPRPPVQSFRGGARRLALPAPLAADLRTFARREGVTLYMALAAAFGALLRRHSGQTDLLVGTPLANRGRSETEGLIGFFVNTLVIRMDVAADPGFRALVRQVRQTVLEVHATQDLPLEKLVEELQLERDLSRTPLFQVVFALQTVAVKLPELPGIGLDFEPVHTGTSKFDLLLDLSATPDGVAGYFEYSADLFDGATVERLAAHLLSLLRAALADPALPLGGLPLLAAAERHQVLVESNDTAAAPPAEGCVHRLFEAWAQRAPGAVAVVGGERRITYGDLDRRANQLAHHLARLGAGPDVPVALCLERSPDLIVGMLGILKAGGAYVPLDPGYPESRAAWLLGDSGSRIVVTEQSLAGRFAAGGLHVVRLDADAAALAAEPAAPPPSRTAAANLAYVIYTSGSTGRPKGVAVEHRHILSYLRGITPRLALAGAASFATVSTFAADLGNTAVYPALCGGGCLHLVAHEQAADAQALGDYFQRHPVDCLKLVPSHLEALLDSPRPAAVLPRRRLVLGGEAPSRELIARLRRLAPSCRVLNHYGPSETTVGVLTQALGNGEDPGAGAAALPLGRPLAGVQVHLLGARLEPVPLGVAGEIHIGGASVARGYLHRPDLTAERFIPDPFGAQPGERLYRTGDRGRRLATGEIVFLGRLDDQLKFHGYRIEPNEIRAALNRHPKVRDSLAVLRREDGGRDQLIGYYVSRQDLDSAELRDFLADTLIEETIPTLFVRLGKIPLTLNGKVNLAALPSLDEIRGKARLEHVAPRTPTETALCRIWMDVLGIDRLSVRDNFFELGGHSLLATRVLARIRQTFAVTPPLRTFFEKPTIARFAVVITQLQSEQEDGEEMARMLDELAGLGESDLRELLEAEMRLDPGEPVRE